VDRFVNGHVVLGERRLGSTKQVTVDGPLDPAKQQQATAAGLELAPVPLQDLFVHLTTTKRAEEPR
jgi:ABC-2 type transport system ATP-binding protein